MKIKSIIIIIVTALAFVGCGEEEDVITYDLEGTYMLDEAKFTTFKGQTVGDYDVQKAVGQLFTFEKVQSPVSLDFNVRISTPTALIYHAYNDDPLRDYIFFGFKTMPGGYDLLCEISGTNVEPKWYEDGNRLFITWKTLNATEEHLYELWFVR